jgi:hypothetical protein
MTINFRKIGESDEVEQILKKYLHIGISNIAEVQSFLEAENLRCSELVAFSGRYAHYLRHPEDLITEDFDSCIRCHIKNVAWSRVRQKRSGRWPWQWLWNWILAKTITWDYFVHFSFRNQTLVQIAVWKVGTGL